MSDENNKKPVKSFKAGWVEASCWKRETEKNGQTVTNYSVRIQKQYRNKNGDYETTPYFFKRDLGDLVLVANKMYEYLSLREQTNEEEIPV